MLMLFINSIGRCILIIMNWMMKLIHWFVVEFSEWNLRCSSSCSLNWKFDAFFIVFKRSNDIGSITQESSVFTLLIATYVMPAVRSRGPISIQAFSRVSPWILCIVVA